MAAELRRALHWVFKVGNLKKSMDFYTTVFNMKVLRHEVSFFSFFVFAFCFLFCFLFKKKKKKNSFSLFSHH